MSTATVQKPSSMTALPLVPEVTDYPNDIDNRDKGTADSWIPRHPGLIRLTGKHPFNAEPAPDALVDAGFITPVPIHYVRNHGPVPKLTWESHRLTVSGLGIAKDRVFSMDQLAAMELRSLPVTLVCAGNRRKEVNMTKPSEGFSWGPAAVSTSVWTGVPLYALLRHCGINMDEAGPDSWVCFDGPDGELPKGVYGTSVTLRKAMDPSSDIMVAFKQNHELLKPDHGFPVRIIIPGFIGGRMIKWLTRISVTAEESTSYYHYYDNRLLPSMVDPDRSRREDWWHKPDYIINDLNLNSAITHPAHNEDVIVGRNHTTYKVRGYAYSGGGHRVRRVELSFDDGQNWEVVNMSPEEYPTEYGRYWCWRLWEMEVDVLRLVGAHSILCRAWDDCQNTQPRDLTWSVTGMMNNCWYRVKTSPCRTTHGDFAVRMDHPVMAGPLPGGWMARAHDANQAGSDGGKGDTIKPSAAADSAKIQPASQPNLPRIHPADMAKHNTKDDCWIAIHGMVYDVSPYMLEHPGGVGSLVNSAGQDVTEDFDAIHSPKAKALLAKYLVGILDSNAPLMDKKPVATDIITTTNSHKPGRMICRLARREVLGADLLLLRFALPSDDMDLAMAVGHHISLRVRINDRLVLRSYTPVDDGIGYFDLLIRVYRANQHPKFPEGGIMSQYLDSLPLDGTIEVDPPHGSITYEGLGSFNHLGDRFTIRHIAAIAGGTGITPIMQVIRAILSNEEDNTTISLIYAARSPSDLMLRHELNALAKTHVNFRVWYTVDTLEGPEPEVEQDTPWPYSTGFVTDGLMAEHLPKAGPNVVALMCGPPPMLKFAVKPGLERLGYVPRQCLTF